MHKHIISIIHIYIYTQTKRKQRKFTLRLKKKTRLHVGHICLVSSPIFSYKYTVLEIDPNHNGHVVHPGFAPLRWWNRWAFSRISGFLATETIAANLSPTFEAFFIGCQFGWYNSSNWVCLKIEDTPKWSRPFYHFMPGKLCILNH